MRTTLLLLLISFLFTGCGKDKFTSIPQIKYKSANTTELSRGQVLRFIISYTDKEGDLQDSIYIEQSSLNCRNTFFKETRAMPAFPKTGNAEGEIEISYGYRVPNFPSLREPQCGVNDTCIFRFMLKDNAQNRSDTIRTEAVIIVK
ncbi:MAG: hypothetical protein RL172_2308 [Bacteroidota bacterium]|jgi:hypothetical protein